MSRLVATELLKLRSTRSILAAVAAAPAVAALVAVAICTASGRQGNPPLGPDSLEQVLGGPANAVTLVAILLGVVAMAGEYRHGTIITTFLACPRRGRVVVAKLAAAAVAGAAMAGLSLAVSVVIAVPWLRSADVDVLVDGDLAAVAAGLVGSTALYAALGVAVGSLARNQTTATTVVVVWLLAVEGLVAGVVGRPEIVRWLPAAAGRAIVHPGATGLPVPVAAGVFAAYVVAFALAATRLTVRRDIT